MPKKKSSPWANNGGARPGAGAPAGPDGPKVTLALRVPQKVKDFLSTLNASQFVATHVLKSKAFRDWEKTSGKPNSDD